MWFGQIILAARLFSRQGMTLPDAIALSAI
jgi:hypothetical protein